MDTQRKGERDPELGGERNGKKRRNSLYAPISTTGILGLIIQMWMLLLENTRSRVDALSPAQERKLKSATAKKKKKKADMY